MFDKTITIASTDGTVSLTIVAGTEGLKSLTLASGGKSFPITAQQLMDVAAQGLAEWAKNES